jgi:hypothetical protein
MQCSKTDRFVRSPRLECALILLKQFSIGLGSEVTAAEVIHTVVVLAAKAKGVHRGPADDRSDDGGPRPTGDLAADLLAIGCEAFERRGHRK